MRFLALYWPIIVMVLVVAVRVFWVLKMRGDRKGRRPPEA